MSSYSNCHHGLCVRERERLDLQSELPCNVLLQQWACWNNACLSVLFSMLMLSMHIHLFYCIDVVYAHLAAVFTSLTTLLSCPVEEIFFCYSYSIFQNYFIWPFVLASFDNSYLHIIFLHILSRYIYILYKLRAFGAVFNFKGCCFGMPLTNTASKLFTNLLVFCIVLKPVYCLLAIHVSPFRHKPLFLHTHTHMHRERKKSLCDPKSMFLFSYCTLI